MLVYAGIDEAGYGPMLGPLCVASTCFVIADADPAAGPPDLWKALSGAVCRKASDKKKRIAIDDSKRLKGASSARLHPCRHLERGLGAWPAVGGCRAGAAEHWRRNLQLAIDGCATKPGDLYARRSGRLQCAACCYSV